MKKSILLLFILTLVLSFSLLGCNNNQGDEEKEHEHTYEETVFLPTCQEKGYTVRLCTGCGETTNYNFVKQSEHTAGEWTVTKESTCKSVGSREQRCIYCDKVMAYDSVPLGEHVTAWTTTKLPTCSTMGTEELKCTVCGKSVDARATETTDNHEFELFVTPPTEDKDGYTTYKCKRCSYSEVGDYVKLENKELTAQEIYEKIAGATVKVFAYDKRGKQFSSGSGFVVTNDGKLITNFHVIDGAYTVKVKFYSGEFYNVTNVLGYDKSNDVAVIKITIDTDKYLNISTEKVKTGDTVYALGSPLGVENIFSQGIVSRESISANGIDCIAFTAPISPGNSGGPLVNTKGEVVGINSMYMPDGQNLNFAILIEKVIALNLNNPTTTQALYSSMLKENAFDILCNYINVHYNALSGDIPMIFKETPETATDVGAEYVMAFDSEEGCVYVQMIISSGGQRKYAIEMSILDTGGAYRLTFYDYEANQTTIEAYVNSSIVPNNYATDFDAIFKIGKFRYDTNDDSTVARMEQIFFTMYQGLRTFFLEQLSSSGTGLIPSHFQMR